jgi:uncharacterized protein
MLLVDTNVLVYAHRPEADRHKDYRDWLEGLINGPEPYAVADLAVNGMVRVVTDQRIYRTPTPLGDALFVAAQIRNQPHARVVHPGPRFWQIFTDVCRVAEARGRLIPGAYLAALAIEHGCELVSDDRDFGRFTGLRWRHPLG